MRETKSYKNNTELISKIKINYIKGKQIICLSCLEFAAFV